MEAAKVIVMKKVKVSAIRVRIQPPVRFVLDSIVPEKNHDA